MNDARNAVPFSPSGINKGKVPWPDPVATPGPGAYQTKGRFEYGYSPHITTKRSATFCSIVGRDSFFDKMVGMHVCVCMYEVTVVVQVEPLYTSYP